VTRVGVEVERLEDEFHHSRVFRFENVVCEDPRKRHFDRELNALAHCQFEIIFSEPELGQIATFGQRFYEMNKIAEKNTAISR